MQPNGSEYPTQCSMIYDPVNNNIYISLKRDFKKLWKLSLKGQMIESYSDFLKTGKDQAKAQWDIGVGVDKKAIISD